MRDLLADLNEQQQEVVKATKGPVLVLAGAGSGKTRALTYRIAYLLQQKIARPEEILAVTFTNKAATEMKERVTKIVGSGVATPTTLCTFHSLGAKILREQARLLPRPRSFVICDTGDGVRLIRRAFDELGLSKKEYNPKRLQARISSLKNKGLQVSTAADFLGKDKETVGLVWARYEKLLALNGAYDFDDLLIEPVRLLENHAGVRAGYKKRWRFISVDEYQDTNPPQDSLLKLLAGKEKNLCVVGDDYQAIYSWRGAKVDHILNFAKVYPNCKTIYLTRNYRSTPQILSAANRVIAANREQKHKKLWTNKNKGEEVAVVALESNRQEAIRVREEIASRVAEGKRRGDCVILYRTNAQSRAFEEEFLTHQVPYTIVGGWRFYERREVKDALAFLGLWVNPNSLLSVERIANALWRGVGPKTLSSWGERSAGGESSLLDIINQESASRVVMEKVVKAFAKARRAKPAQVSDLLEFLIKESGYWRWLKGQLDGEERVENLEELLNVTAGYVEVEKFLEEVALLSDIDTLESEQDRVTCMTLHAAKGLEFPYVFLVGCEEGLLPHSNALNSRAEIEEERRLMYVGMTRAQKQLIITYALTRYMGGDVVTQAPSRFLESLPESIIQETQKSDWLLGGEESEGEPVLAFCEEGDFVQHNKFGRGVVIEVKASTVICVFENYGVRAVNGEVIKVD